MNDNPYPASMTPFVQRDPRVVSGALLWIVLLITGCGATEMSRHHPLVVAHRGDSASAPENTVAAFDEAWRRGADAIEGDFRLTADGVVVCLHDETLERTTGDPRRIADVPARALRELEAGSWFEAGFVGERLPLLEEVLSLVPPGRRLLLEIKSGPETVEPIAALLAESGLAPRQVVIIAFDEDVVRTSRRLLPDHSAWLLSGFRRASDGTWSPTVEELLARTARCGADGLGVQGRVEVVDRDFVAACHEADLTLNVWTVDDPGDARRLADVGVDSITTNRPGRIRNALAGDDD